MAQDHQPCPECHGAGRLVAGQAGVSCPACGGSGRHACWGCDDPIHPNNRYCSAYCEWYYTTNIAKQG